ncbi:MAG TPA: ATP synthase F1 subunit epsilon [Cyclobacteriaceae bacterium]
MFLELITPDEKVFDGEVESAILPGSEGYFQVLNNHAPLISSLGKGDLKLKQKKKEIIYEVEGGTVEVLNNVVTVLAEVVHKE